MDINLDKSDFIITIENRANELESNKDSLFKIITFVHRRDEMLKDIEAMVNTVKSASNTSSDLSILVRDFLQEVAMKTTKIYNDRITNYLKED